MLKKGTILTPRLDRSIVNVKRDVTPGKWSRSYGSLMPRRSGWEGHHDDEFEEAEAAYA
ncbi:MAG: hypothetical protein H6512_15460 [Acidimicrobiia bacterium]|nr:hypothetical protein [Acidimicrobiia bacterium]